MEVKPEVLDGIRELISIGVGRAAGMLNQMTHAHVTLSVPEIRMVPASEVRTYIPCCGAQASIVTLGYSGILTGETALLIPHSSALNLVTLLTGEEGSTADMDALRVETLLEVGNIIISAVMGSISNLVTSHLCYLLPTYQEDWISSLPLPEQGLSTGIVIIAKTRFEVHERKIEGDILLILDGDSLQRLGDQIEKMMNGR